MALLVSPHGSARFGAALDWLVAQPASSELLLLAASLDAANELARAATRQRGAVFGWYRESLSTLAARLAALPLSGQRRTPAGALALEALCVRVISELEQEDSLGRLAGIADRPGLPRALCRTFAELGMAGVDPSELSGELGAAYGRYRALLELTGLADRAAVLRAATLVARSGEERPLGLPTCCYDVAAPTRLEQEFLAALRARAPNFLATLPRDDAGSRHAFGDLAPAPAPSESTGTGSLMRLQNHLFTSGISSGAADDQVVLLSAPGEARECVEIARRVLSEAERGVPLDQMAILLRSPAQYRSHLIEALRRAGIPAHFSGGTRRPDPAGRALLALLACAAEGLSATRFAEYLSLAVVPAPSPDGSPPAPLPREERRVAVEGDSPTALLVAQAANATTLDPANARSSGPESHERALRVPRRWEALLVDAAVIGGLSRWQRRLAGLTRALELEASRLADDDDTQAALARRLEELKQLSAFALPLVEALAALPESAPWGDWLDALGALATRAIHEPDSVLAILAELEPMRSVGPVTLAEVRVVLQQWLAESVGPRRPFRGGELVVASIDEVRGRVFDVVFVPGLAEKILPQRVSEDPLLLDAERRRLSPALPTQEQRVAAERLALSLAVGAARARVVLSYPRFETDKARPRVPSFYALEVLRAAEGRLPSFAELAQRADAMSQTRMGWPAPREPAQAIDAAEYDLSVLSQLFREGASERAGAAYYLMNVNERLARALRFRGRRWHRKWWNVDGFVDPGAAGRAALLARRARLDERGFAVTALERYAACPYRFYLATLVGLRPRESAEAIEELDPATRGLLAHELLRALGSELSTRGLLPLAESDFEDAAQILEQVFQRITSRYQDDLAPAIERVWRDAMLEIRTDLRRWLLALSRAPEWVPAHFELGFGLRNLDSDPASRDEPVTLDFGLRLRGSIDAVERRGDELRATDYKTGQPRAPGFVLGGGKFLQPVLYALVLEKLFPGRSVVGGRAYYCTSRGQFLELGVRADERAREGAAFVHATIESALREGFFPAAPEREACSSCEFKRVCGPYEPVRLRAKKELERLQPLEALRQTR